MEAYPKREERVSEGERDQGLGGLIKEWARPKWERKRIARKKHWLRLVG